MVYDEGDQLRSDQEERRREKFSRERGGDYLMDRGRRNFGGPDRRDYSNGLGGAKKRAFREEDSYQPTKRSRFDSAADSYEPQFNRRSDGSFPPIQTDATSAQSPMLLTFRKFLDTQDDAILTDEEAIAKYNEYKTEFMRQECERYFHAHKDDEWFRRKYHPLESKERRTERRQHIQKRLQIFNELFDSKKLDGLTLSYEHAEQLIRFMDMVVIKLEDGTDEDIEAAAAEPINDESVMDLLSSEQDKLQKQTQTDDNMPDTILNDEDSSPTKRLVRDVMDAVLDASDDAKRVDEGADEGEEQENLMELNPPIQPLKQAPLPHKTCSIHFRTVPSTVPLAEIENLCKQHPGFLRLSLSDPMPVVIDTRSGKPQPTRTALVTYREDVNIKEIFWAMRNVKFNGISLNASVNREFRRRVRSIGATSGLSSHRNIVQNDIRQAAKLIVLYDLKEGLYREENETCEEGEEQLQNEPQSADETFLSDLEGAVLKSRNPLLNGISDYLVDETSAEEDALAENVAQVHGTELMEEIEKDNKMIKVLDSLLIYLRIVHSIDFYAAIEYSNEDEMPHRFGLIHVRGRPLDNISTTTNTRVPLLPKTIINGHIATFNALLDQGLFKRALLPEEELQKLGKKDAEKAVQDFLDKNTVEQAPGKYLCPLSGKRFRAVEFVHKHLHSKHQEEIDVARHEALYFNSYLCDPNRPHNQIFAKITNTASVVEREIRRSSASPPPRRNTQNSTLEEGAGGGRDSERPAARSTWQPSDRFNSSGGGNNRYNGGGPGQRSFVGITPGVPTRQRFSYEPVNEVSGAGSGGFGGGRSRVDPRAPPSYRDLDAPTEDII
ncbi:hypothetical protein ACQ4LE_011169 [Meloidogyne hapla]|uniref:Serrate RNA effector molecule homolog n=1 Tax=Meloidogyne hapla TaxID=6305 RepID=A0A1I8AX66_MELHA